VTFWFFAFLNINQCVKDFLPLRKVEFIKWINLINVLFIGFVKQWFSTFKDHFCVWFYLARLRTARKFFWAIPKKYVIILPPYLGLNSNHITKRVKSCVNRFYSFVIVKVIFQNTLRLKSFFPYEDRLNRSQLSKVIYKASCWDCNDFYIGKTKRRLHYRKLKRNISRDFWKTITLLLLLITLKTPVTTSDGDYFDVLKSGKTDYHCKVKETLFMQGLQPSLNVNVRRKSCYFISIGFPLFISFYRQFPFETS